MNKTMAVVPALLLAEVLLTGCAVPQKAAPVPYRLMLEPTTGAQYFLYVPTTYRREKPAPLIVSCHGTPPYDVAAHHVRELSLLAEQHGCLLLCPKLSSTDGLLGTGPTPSLLEDERRVMTIIGQLHYLYNIDRKNVLITGFSGGGFPVYFIGLRHPDIFTAIAARSCNFNRHSVENWYPAEAMETAIIVYFGENDPGAIQGQSRNAIDFLRAAGFQVETLVIPRIGHERRPEYAMKFWLQHWNGSPPPSELFSRNLPVLR
jgi:poly(3-hydroxybutyrate) depolymerase